MLWSYLQPLLMMIVYWLVFSVLLRATGGIHNYPQFVLTGLAMWTFFQGGVVFGTASLVANGELMKKVWFPRPVIPTAVVLAQITTSLVMFARDRAGEPDHAPEHAADVPARRSRCCSGCCC